MERFPCTRSEFGIEEKVWTILREKGVNFFGKSSEHLEKERVLGNSRSLSRKNMRTFNLKLPSPFQ
jgi:hypothetical protein